MQETEYVFGVTPAQGSTLTSNEMRYQTKHPDASAGTSSTSEVESGTFNNLGETLTKTDRNGSVHTYVYDVVGRQISDTVTTLGTGVDGSTRRVEMNYDGQGNVFQITNYDATTAGNVTGQIQRGYNGLGQLTTEFHATSGTVNTASTPKVQYAYSEMPSGANHSRLTSITYPNGRVLSYQYATGLNNSISRLSSIVDGSTTLESYDYLGYGTVVRRAHAQPGVDLTYIKLSGESNGSAGDQYTGMDQFGRVIDQRWTTSGGTTADRFAYGYDRDGNRLYKQNLVSTSNSELYSYDGLNQLSAFQRGTLNAAKTALTGTASRSQSWDFDALGNFDSQTTDGTTQTRTANKQNEITSISGATTPTYDANGNLTKDETGRTFTYDSWNRLATVKNPAGTLVASYKWDGMGRRVRETRGSTTTDLYYSDQWQVLEERVGGVARFSYAWSPVYVDALIARDRDTDANGSLDERLYAVQDANFNVTALLSTAGAVVERFQYDPFGRFAVLDAAWASRASSSYGWNYLHQGGRWDADGGVYSFRNRELSPTLGRWLQIDPIGFAAGDENLYRAYNGNSVNILDALGLDGPIPRYMPPSLNMREAGRSMLGGPRGFLRWELQVLGQCLRDGATGTLGWLEAANRERELDRIRQERQAQPQQQPQAQAQPQPNMPPPTVPPKKNPPQPELYFDPRLDTRPPRQQSRRKSARQCTKQYDDEMEACKAAYPGESQRAKTQRLLCFQRAMNRYSHCLQGEEEIPPLFPY